jgi:predicted PurR-regulated permease PerM
VKGATTTTGPSPNGRTALASVAAIASVIAASSCCLPILPFVFAASLAGSATVLNALRPYLLGASVLFIAYGFYQAWQNKRCSRKPSVVSSVLLWLSACFVFVSIFFPQVLANAAANLLAR